MHGIGAISSGSRRSGGEKGGWRREERERSGEVSTFRGSWVGLKLCVVSPSSGMGLLPVAGVLWEGGVERTILSSLSSLSGPG